MVLPGCPSNVSGNLKCPLIVHMWIVEEKQMLLKSGELWGKKI